MNLTAMTMTLGTVMGLQALRAFLPLLVYVLRDRFGYSSVTLGLLGAAVMASGFLFPLLVRRVEPARAVMVSVVSLAVARGALQLWKGDPVGSLVLAGFTVVLFLAFLAAVSRQAARAPGAFLLGAFLDTVLHAAAGTRDLHWGGTTSDLGALLLVGVALVSAWRMREAASEGPPASSRAMLIWGPLVLLHLEVFGNVARVSAQTGWPTGVSGAVTALGITAGMRLAKSSRRPGAILASALLLLGLVGQGITGPLAVAILWAGQLGAASALTAAFAREGRGGTLATSGFFGLGSVLFLVLLFAHYAAYDLPHSAHSPDGLPADGHHRARGRRGEGAPAAPRASARTRGVGA